MKTLRRISAVGALCAAIAAVGFTVDAHAAAKTGTYKGKTAQGAKLSLKVTSDRLAVVKFSFASSAFTCTDGDAFSGKGFTTPATERIEFENGGVFGFTADMGDGIDVTDVSGQVVGSKAKGTISRTVRFDENDNLDAEGSVVCTTGPLRWSAKRQ